MTKAKTKVGHVPTEKTRAMVAVLKAHCMTDVNIGVALGICYKTLRKHYKVELDTGSDTFRGKVLGAVAKMLLSEDPKTQTMKIFWLKTQLRWQEPPRLLELPASGPGRIEDMSDEDLTTIVASRARRERAERERRQSEGSGRGRGRPATKKAAGEEESS